MHFPWWVGVRQCACAPRKDCLLCGTRDETRCKRQQVMTTHLKSNTPTRFLSRRVIPARTHPTKQTCLKYATVSPLFKRFDISHIFHTLRNFLHESLSETGLGPLRSSSRFSSKNCLIKSSHVWVFSDSLNNCESNCKVCKDRKTQQTTLALSNVTTSALT
jgi:hypothetical protein